MINLREIYRVLYNLQAPSLQLPIFQRRCLNYTENTLQLLSQYRDLYMLAYGYQSNRGKHQVYHNRQLFRKLIIVNGPDVPYKLPDNVP